MTEGELQLALFSSNHWPEESRQVRLAGAFALWHDILFPVR